MVGKKERKRGEMIGEKEKRERGTGKEEVR